MTNAAFVLMRQTFSETSTAAGISLHEKSLLTDLLPLSLKPLTLSSAGTLGPSILTLQCSAVLLGCCKALCNLHVHSAHTVYMQGTVPVPLIVLFCERPRLQNHKE